ncbi:MAG: hypothetical protein K6G47_05905 [Clostridia bacterium]|nr:hypothetical protein [Clostridia bacterium]
MKKKFLLKVASALLSTGILISLIPSAVLADDDVITVDGHDFVKQEDGMYKCQLDTLEYWTGGSHAYHYVYNLLTQEIIDRDFGGTLPDIVNPTQENVYFYLGEDITITHGVKVKEYSAAFIELQGRTITYDPEDISEYLWDASGIKSSSLKLLGNYFYNEPSELYDGKVYSPKGAPIARIDGESSDVCSEVRISNISVVGGYGTNYADKRYSAFNLLGYAKLYTETESIISYFSAEQGGAIRASGNTQVWINGEITRCIATEGGGIYSEGRVIYGGSMTSNEADRKGGAICMVGENAQFESTYSTDGRPYYLIPKITYNKCHSYEATNEGGGGIYIDSGRESPVILDNEINIFDNNRNMDGTKKNLYIVCDDGLKDYIHAYYYNDTEFKVGISAYGLNEGDALIKVPSYSTSVGIAYYTDRFIYETSDNSTLEACTHNNPDDSRHYYLEFEYIADKDKTTSLCGYSLITDGTSIGIRFCVYFSEGDIRYGLDQFTAKISTVDGSECCLLGSNEQTLTRVDAYAEGYRAYTYYLDSMDMTVPLKFELYKKGKDEPVCSMSGFTVRDYIDVVISNPGKYGQAGVKTAICLALYGAASQKYFNFREYDLADSIITDDMREKVALSDQLENYKNTIFYDPADTRTGSNMPFNIAPSEHLSFYGWTMSFKGKTSLKFYFLPMEGFTIDDFFISGYYPDNATMYAKGQYIIVQFSDITMEDVIEGGHIYIAYNQGEGYQDEMDLFFKPINYITRMLKKDNNTAEAKELFEAFYLLAMQFLPDYYVNYFN